MKKATVIGIDLAKSSFSVCGMCKNGKVLYRKTLSRAELARFTVQLEPTLIGIEACGGSHHWARLFQSQGHQVKMMSTHRVKAFAPARKKNDAVDAEAICLATFQSSVPSVRVKGVEQQDLDMLLNYREQLVKQRTALSNQVHAIGLEYGVALPKSKTSSQLGIILDELEDANNEMTQVARNLIFMTLQRVRSLEQEIADLEKQLTAMTKQNENFKLLTSIPGIGVITAVAILAHTGGDMSTFKNGRQFAAYLGLTPRQYSTGGKTKLMGLTKSGDPTIRRLLVVGTNSVLRLADKKDDRLSKWATEKKATKAYRVASVALANKMARIAYGVLKNQQAFAC